MLPHAEYLEGDGIIDGRESLPLQSDVRAGYPCLWGRGGEDAAIEDLKEALSRIRPRSVVREVDLDIAELSRG